MKAKTKLIALLGYIVLALTFSIAGQSDNTQKTRSDLAKKCSPIIEGLRFCTTTPIVSAKSGENVTVVFSLQNMTGNTISVLHGRFYEFYNTKVTDSKGIKIYSKEEIQQKRYKKATVVTEEMISELPINSLPRTVTLDPKQETRIEFNFSDFYDFTSKGKYYIDVRRKIVKKVALYPTPKKLPVRRGIGSTELSFGIIEVEIK